MKFTTTRRFLLAGIGATLLPKSLLAQSGALVEIEDLRPGEFVWHPDRAPNGPVAVIVSLPRQLVHVYRNGIRIAVSTCSNDDQIHCGRLAVFCTICNPTSPTVTVEHLPVAGSFTTALRV